MKGVNADQLEVVPKVIEECFFVADLEVGDEVVVHMDVPIVTLSLPQKLLRQKPESILKFPEVLQFWVVAGCLFEHLLKIVAVCKGEYLLLGYRELSAKD